MHSIFPHEQQERALQYVEDAQGDIEITEGIKLVETEKPQAQGRSLNEIDLPTEPEARESEIDSLLVDRAARFLGSHTLQFKVPKDSIEDMQRSLDEGKQNEKKNCPSSSHAAVDDDTVIER